MKIEIDTQTENQLKAFAAHDECSPEDLANSILRQQINRRDRFEAEKADDNVTLKAMEQGSEFDNDSVMSWLDSWGKDNELPCPTMK